MKASIACLVGLFCLAIVSSAAEKSSAAALLDEAIWWPGDYGQVCTDGSGYGSLSVPWMHGFGTIVPQEYFLSKEMLGRLQQQRTEVVAEILVRLRALDWRHPPKGDVVSDKVRDIERQERSKMAEIEKRQGPIPAPRPRKHENNRMLGATMLRIIEGLDAVETMTELLRLEELLHELNEKAMKFSYPKPPSVDLPAVETGGRGIAWDGFEETENSPRKKQMERVFENTVFEMEILGVCLGMMQRKGWKPLQDSMIGRLHVISEKRHPAAYLPFSRRIREHIRALVVDFITGKEPAVKPVEGAALLNEILAKPGNWNQMCAFPPPVPVPVPMAPEWRLAARHFNLGDDEEFRLQAFRDEVMPVLRERLRNMTIAGSAVKNDAFRFPDKGSGQNGGQFGPVILQIINVTQASECLEDLLRLEQEISDLLAKAEKDQTAAVPKLRIDSPVFLEKGSSERDLDAHILRIYQRELLGLVKTLLLREGHEPMQKSAFMIAQRAADEAELEKVARTVRKAADIPWHLRSHLGWNEVTGEIFERSNETPIAQTPYSEAVRSEIRRIAEEFTRQTPVEKRKGAESMPLSWLNF